MIDFLKAKIKRIDPIICEKSDQMFLDSINRQRSKNGFSTTLVYQFAALKIRITDANTFLEGSLHKMYNEVYTGNPQNFDEFHFGKLCEIIEYICNHLKIKPENLIIQNLEYGLNITTSLAPARILSAHTIHYKSKSVCINRDEISGEEAKYYRWQLSEYWIKLYDKGLHFNKRQNLLRLEKKITKSRSLRKIGIRTLYDLLDVKLFPLLLNDLVNEWQQICVVDYLQGLTAMTYDERNLFLIMVNPKTYEAYQNCDKTSKNRKAMQRLHFKFKLLNERFKFDKIHTEILQCIKAKSMKMSQNPQYM